MTDSVFVFCTCANGDEALRIADALVEEHLAACVNVLPPIRSIYRWQGAHRDGPRKCCCSSKPPQPRFPALRERIAEAAQL